MIFENYEDASINLFQIQNKKTTRESKCKDMFCTYHRERDDMILGHTSSLSKNDMMKSDAM